MTALRNLVPLFLTAALTLSSIGAAKAAAMLRREVRVEGAVVTLGDLVEGAGAAGKAVVTEAPPPGEQRILSIGPILRLAKSQGLDMMAPADIRRVSVQRTSKLVPHGEIVAALEQAVADRGAHDGTDQIDVRLANRNLEIHVAVDAPIAPWVESLRYDRRGGRFTATMRSAPAADAGVRFDVAGRVEEMAEIPVLVRAIAKGETIGREDVSWQRVARDRLGRGIVEEPADIVGLAPRRSLGAGDPLRARDLVEPKIVSKGALVLMVVESPAMTLTATGRTLENGALGDVVRIVNLQSHKTVQGVVVAENRVAIPARSASLAAN